MPVRAVQTFRKMPGGTQSQLMLCSDANLWVVKFKNNPQHIHVLAKELITARIARSIGLSVPRSDTVEISADLIGDTEEMWIENYRGPRERCTPGVNFGSQFVGGLMPGRVVGHLPAFALRDVVNLSEFAGALVLDIWTCNADSRQAVFRTDPLGHKYEVFFIDHGHNLNLGKWRINECPSRGFYKQREVYENVRNYDNFQPWLDRAKLFDAAVLWKFVMQVPEEWGFGTREDLEMLVEEVLDRGKRIFTLVSTFINSRRGQFH